MEKVRSDAYQKWEAAIIAKYGSMEAYLEVARENGREGGLKSQGGFRDVELARSAGRKGGGVPRMKTTANQHYGHNIDLLSLYCTDCEVEL